MGLGIFLHQFATICQRDMHLAISLTEKQTYCETMGRQLKLKKWMKNPSSVAFWTLHSHSPSRNSVHDLQNQPRALSFFSSEWKSTNSNWMPKNQFECFYHLVIESVKVTTHSFLQKKFTLQKVMDEEVNGCHFCTSSRFSLVGQLRVKGLSSVA